MAGVETRDAIIAALDRLHRAQQAGDIDAVVEQYATDGFVDIEALRSTTRDEIEQGAYRNRDVDQSDSEVFVAGDHALVKPVGYETPNETRYSSYHLSKQGDGQWRIIAQHRSQPRAASSWTPDLLANAATIVGPRGMLWHRRLDASVDEVWDAISTKDGLDRWFLTRSVEIDLRPGGLFQHHWTNTIRDFKRNEFIDFHGVPGDPAGPSNRMRFALTPDGGGTVFALFDTFYDATNPLTLPWTAAGWHCTVDALEASLTGGRPITDLGLGGEFYWSYLREFHQLADIEGGLRSPDTPNDWRSAFLTESL